MPPTEHWDTDAKTTAQAERIGRLADMAYVYIYRWGPRWPEIPGGLNRKGQPCKVTARGRMNTARVEFPDGEFAFVSRNAIGKRKVNNGWNCIDSE